MDGKTGLGRGFAQSLLNLRSVWPNLILYQIKILRRSIHCIKKSIACDAGYYDRAVAKIVTRTLTWVMMICRPTHCRSFFFPFAPPLSLWCTRSPSFSLLFASVILLVSLFHTHKDIIQPILNGAPFWEEEYWEVCHGTWYLLIKSIRSFHISKNIYSFKHTHSHTVSSILMAVHHFIWRHLYISMHATQKPKSKLKFVTLDKESNMSTLRWFLRICSKEELPEKAQDIVVTIPVKKSPEARYNLDPGSFFKNRFWGRWPDGVAINEDMQIVHIWKFRSTDSGRAS